jgi:hypothetical protein
MMGLSSVLGMSDRTGTQELTSRLVAIRAIMELAQDDEARDIAMDELQVLGVKQLEIVTAMLDSPN